MDNANRRKRRGPLPQDVAEQVYAYVSTEPAKGRTLSEICRHGLIVYDHGGNIVRRLKGKYLEAAYRRAERRNMAPWLRVATGYRHGVPMFMDRALPVPIGAAIPSVRKRGRPKKNRLMGN